MQCLIDWPTFNIRSSLLLKILKKKLFLNSCLDTWRQHKYLDLPSMSFAYKFNNSEQGKKCKKGGEESTKVWISRG